MRLFSPTISKAKTTTDEIRRSFLIKQRTEELKKEWDRLNGSFEPEKQRLTKEFLQFTKELQERKSNLLKEVFDLEEQRKKALEPLDAKWLELNEKELTLEAQENALRIREDRTNNTHNELLRKQELLTSMDNQLSKREIAISALQQETRAKYQEVETREKVLVSKEASFAQYVAKTEKKYTAQEEDLASREQVIKVFRESLNEERKNLDVYKVQLDDRQATLERGFSELRLKQQQWQIEHEEM